MLALLGSIILENFHENIPSKDLNISRVSSIVAFKKDKINSVTLFKSIVKPSSVMFSSFFQTIENKKFQRMKNLMHYAL